MLAYDDVDHDTHLNLNEFYAAFSKLYSKALAMSSWEAVCCFYIFTQWHRSLHHHHHGYRNLGRVVRHPDGNPLELKITERDVRF